VYTPGKGFVGTDSFVYAVFAEGTAVPGRTATVTIEVVTSSYYPVRLLSSIRRFVARYSSWVVVALEPEILVLFSHTLSLCSGLSS
jgi:hypothetical protein